ncbi:glycoside hydrolase family 71 protein [Cylindrobasidium torrendii FP15055 ss-10]|uniref:Glycoside hydrolase family 71 protein n=1 Tax=Cylindrobasidium torrendii FP15055 ss-10 TaxID=1314674 RepID=A0A0D7AWI4_9AGAR|nr:glycoside hydrolase family 71 protein [Cylindrobasidium torrendii FP15055 ss-10]
MRSFTTLTGLAILLSTATPSYAALKDVFAHYMIGGMEESQATEDVLQAKAIGIDAFALNVQNVVDSWAVNSIQWIFAAAEANDFKLFFSFDMAVKDDVSYFLDTFRNYSSTNAYYKHDNKPVISTFYGATLTFGSDTPNNGWQTHLRDALDTEIYFIPGFSNAPNGPTDFFSTYPVVDGVFSWDSAWPYEQDGNVNVSSKADEQYLSGAKDASKQFMMPISPVQYKHIADGQNWYRKGELNLGLRVGQVLSVAPDFVEIITWNDAGESHYIGPIWSKAIENSPIPAYTDGYDHAAWQNVFPPFIKAFKEGVTDLTQVVPTEGKVAGAFWYRPLLTTASCSGDSLGKPSNAASAEDAVNVALYLAEPGYTVTISSGGSVIAEYQAVQGLNAFFAPGIKTGGVTVEVKSGGNSLVSASSTVDVAADTDGTCNFNYQVVGLKA